MVAASLQTALNAALRLDPETRSRLAALEGRIIAIELRGLGLILYLTPDAAGIRVRDRPPGEPAVRIRGTPLALARHWRDVGTAGGGIAIEGDTAVARELQTALARLEIDWEEQLSHRVGDVAAYQAGRWWRAARSWGRRSADTLRADGGEYLQRELRLLPPPVEVEHFLAAVDGLREDADRLTARIERLRRRLAAGDSI